MKSPAASSAASPALFLAAANPQTPAQVKSPAASAAANPQAPAQVWAVMAGGGTAGHVLPGLAVAEALSESGRKRESLHFFLSRRPEDAALLEESGFSASAIPGKGLPRKISLSSLKALASILRGVWTAWLLLRRLKPSVVLLQGGYVSASCAVAARLRRIPSVVFEANVRPGMASRFSARWASVCAVAFADTELPKGVFTGTPLRASITLLGEQVRGHAETRNGSGPAHAPQAGGPQSSGGPQTGDPQTVTPQGSDAQTGGPQDSGDLLRARAKQSLGVEAGRKLVLVLGGSLGAGRINAAVREASKRLLENGSVAIRHVVGPRAWQEEGQTGADLGKLAKHYAALPFEDDMATALAAADVVVSRAGGGAVAELAAAARPSILIPMQQSAEAHQYANAKAMEDSGAALLLKEADLSAPVLAAELEALLAEPARLSAMAESAAKLARLDAARRVAELLEAQVQP